MFFTQGIYDLDELSRYNLHMHTNFSGCAKPEMTVQSILKTAEDCGIEMIALTDHTMEYEDEFFEHCDILRKAVDEYNSNVKVLIGGEFSLYGVDKYTLKGKDVKTDYRLYSQNHFHVPGWEHPESRDVESYKRLTIDMLHSLFKDKAADTIAHPITDSYLARVCGWEWGTFGKAWSDNELGDIITEGFESDCAWELNVGEVLGDPDLYRRMFNIGKEIGAVFTLGTDAHRLCDVDTKTHLDELKRILY